jgi:hypothetical protein
MEKVHDGKLYNFYSFAEFGVMSSGQMIGTGYVAHFWQINAYTV